MAAQGDWGIWQIFFTLTELTSDQFREQPVPEGEQADHEACLRRVLRPHDEAGFTGFDEREVLEWRNALDKALGEIILREIRRQLNLPYEPLPPDPQKRLLRLFRSEAFLRYLNAYHYFGIRFVPAWQELKAAIAADPQGIGPRPCADANASYFTLAAPPPLTTVPDAEAIFEGFRALVESDKTDPAVKTALDFLDGFESVEAKAILFDLKEPTAFELWLRGLRPETTDALKARFIAISEGIRNWAVNHANFYLNLAYPAEVSIKTDHAPEAPSEGQRPPQGLIVRHPAAARLALADVYWIAKLFRADISSSGAVAYQKYNWIHLVRFRAIFDQDNDRLKDLDRAEEAIRSVFDFVCDLIQNSVEITEQIIEAANPSRKAVHRPASTVSWRHVFDEELAEIGRERGVRHYRDPTLAPQATTGDIAPADSAVAAGAEPARLTAELLGAARKKAESANAEATAAAELADRDHCWSRRLLGSPCPANLIGLAFSGGGIRSATLNLGVLQGLQELDFLRQIDYISTVSGGGFIGSWLIGNVRRSAHWLGRLTDWNASIRHLREYSRYLAPHTGLFSPDTLNIAATWLRNTFLIQISALAWLFVVLLSALGLMRTFVWAGNIPGLDSVILAASAFLVVLSVLIYLGTLPVDSKLSRTRLGRTRSVVRYAVLPAWIGATALASRLWAAASPPSSTWPRLQTACSFGDMLEEAWKPWLLLLVLSAVGFALCAWQTLQRNKLWLWIIAPVCTGVLYLELVALYYAFRMWSAHGDAANSIAFVFGPPLALIAFSIAVLLLIGLSSKNANEAQREWWTRYGTWLGIYAGSGLVICGVALFGPRIGIAFFRWLHTIGHPVLSWATVLGWIGTVVSGLIAGNSSKTGSASQNAKAPLLEALAKVAGFLFILGSFLLGSTLLYVLLYQIFGPNYSVAASDPLRVVCELRWYAFVLSLIATVLMGLLFSSRFEINIFGFSQFYRNRIVRCYLGATRWMAGARNPNPFMKFDFRDDIKFWRFRTDSPGQDAPGPKECDPYRGPFPIINCCLNLAGSSDLGLNTRHGDSFALTPLRCGSARPRVGYAPTWTERTKFADGLQLGQAVAVSGAAVSSNMGYNTSSLVAFLLCMFNVRLGWWFPNPGKDKWNHRGLTFSLLYLIAELFGLADERRDFVNVSDGGHFENLAIYELIRRRCRVIIACDAECDPTLQFGSLGKMIRICQTDFGAEIDLNVDSIRPQDNGLSLAHCAVGTIKYCTGEIGRLIYLKASITGDEDVSIAQYRSQHTTFPHESTANQFYSEDQFESYRRLGLEMVRASFKGNLPGDDPIDIADRMFDVLTPAALSSDKFLRHATALNELWEEFRKSPTLMLFMRELLASSTDELDDAGKAQRPGIPAGSAGGPPPLTDEEFCIGLELIQLMEDVFLDLRLDDYWEHPDYRGWAILLMRWARSPRFREIWKRTHRTFGIRFEYFCNANLGLERDNPIARV
jgi:hypothetical protein